MAAGGVTFEGMQQSHSLSAKSEASREGHRENFQRFQSSSSRGPGVSKAPSRKESKVSRRSFALGSTFFRTTTFSFVGDTEPAYKVLARKVVDNKFVSGFMMTITVYVLCADDVRLLTTDKPADDAFGVVALVCIVLFCIEILLSCVGKPDYFLGFFFVLDLVSTASLILDLPWVLDALSSEDQSNQATKGRTARIGAKAARFVRVLRLVRIFKLYKAVTENSERREREKKKAETGSRPGEEVDDEHFRGQHEELGEESRVGRRLSDMMTRRVIILVLSMLIGVQLLTVDELLLLPQSAFYGADEVWHAALGMEGCPLPSESHNATCERLRSSYERTLLRYLYFHNWFARHANTFASGQPSPASYFSAAFAVGVSSPSEAVRKSQAAFLRLRPSAVEAFNTRESQDETMFQYGTIPAEALTLLGGDWGLSCETPLGQLLSFSMLQHTIPSVVTYAVPCPHGLRPSERTFYYTQRQTQADFDSVHLEFWFDKRPFVQEEAAHSLGMTLFVCVCLLGAAVIFHNDVNQLVLYPVEAMISRVQMIQNDPVQAIKGFQTEEEKEAAGVNGDGGDLPVTTNSVESLKPLQSIGSLGIGAAKKLLQCLSCHSTQPQEPMETLILERTIIKLGSLLVLGFGEAGANIVTQNMRSASSATGASMTSVVAGQRVECVVGTVRIRDFSVVVEVLQSQVMTFVNQVSEIVHGVADEFLGAPNKNNGDTFLVIWRTTGMDEDATARTADFSVIAMARIIGAVSQTPMLDPYRTHPGLQWRYPPGERVKVSTGLHYGWAIEGAVGSEFKIDASYLSPNVSVATNIEEATTVYGVQLLVTDSVVNICGPDMRQVCRRIDKVWVTGSKDPYNLFTVDLYTNDLTLEEAEWRRRPMVWTQRHRFKAKQFLDAEKRQKRAAATQSFAFFKQDAGIQRMRQRHSVEFRQLFAMGYQNFFEGEWQVAKAFMQICQKNLGFADGPSKALLEFIEFHRGEPPEGWDGVRDLEEARRVRAHFDSQPPEQCDSEAGDQEPASEMRSAVLHATSSRHNLRLMARRVARQVKRPGTTGPPKLAVAAAVPDVEPVPSGDGTGGTGSRRGSPVMDEEPVKELVDRLRHRLEPFGQLPGGPGKRRPSSASHASGQSRSEVRVSQRSAASKAKRSLVARVELGTSSANSPTPRRPRGSTGATPGDDGQTPKAPPIRHRLKKESPAGAGGAARPQAMQAGATLGGRSARAHSPGAMARSASARRV